MNLVSNFQTRFSQLLDGSGKSDSAIAKDLGCTKQALSFWRNGQRSPKASAIVAIAEYFNVDSVWLLGYDVPMHPNKTKEQLPKTSEARTLAAGLDRMPKEQRERALMLVKMMFDAADYWEDDADGN